MGGHSRGRLPFGKKYPWESRKATCGRDLCGIPMFMQDVNVEKLLHSKDLGETIFRTCCRVSGLVQLKYKWVCTCMKPK